MPAKLLENPNAIFIHIPKTAGKSILDMWTDSHRAPTSKGEIPGEWLREPKLIFAFVRHPLERLISAWNMFSNGTKHIYDGKVTQRRVAPLKDITLEGFFEHMFAFDDRHEQWSVTTHTLPQTDPWNLLQYAQYIGRHESLAEDWYDVQKMLRVAPRDLPHRNVSEKEVDWTEEFDKLPQGLQNKVLEYYSKDFEELQYGGR